MLKVKRFFLQDSLQKAITFPKPLLQIADKPTILESLDVSEYLVLRAKDAHSKPTEVRKICFNV